MLDKSAIASDFNRQGAEFLKVELKTGLTFAKIALGEEAGSEERFKNLANARKAFQTVLRLRERFIYPSDAATRDIQDALDRLRSALEELGENVPRN